MHALPCLLLILVLGVEEPPTATTPATPDCVPACAEPLEIVPLQRRFFDMVEVDWVWPRITPRFLHDFPRQNLQLEPTLGIQAAMCDARRIDSGAEEPLYFWFSARALGSSGSVWRFQPQEGYGFLHADFNLLFIDWQVEKIYCEAQSDFLGHVKHTVSYARVGVRFAQIGIDSDWQTALFPRHTEDQFYGVGPFVGWHVTHSLHDGQFQLFHDLEISGIFGGVYQRDEGQFALDAGTVIPFAASGVRSRFISGFRARAGFHWYEDFGRMRCRFSLGYQGEYFSHLGDEIDSLTVHYQDGRPIGVETDKKAVTDLLSHGPFVQCEIRY